jgi:hypothetical protein
MCVKCKQKAVEIDERTPRVGFLQGLEELRRFQTEKHQAKNKEYRRV